MTHASQDSGRASPEVVVRLGGRLGNQMFQYAAGKALATRLGANLTLEGLAPESGRKSRVQILEAFGLSVPFRPVAKGLRYRWTLKLARLGLPVRLHGLPLYLEPHFHYDKTFTHVDSGCYMVGGWVSPHYFEDIRELLLTDFAFKGQLSEGAAATLEAIRNTSCSVAMHVRRGDYVNDPRIRARLGICEADYYQAAMRLLRRSHPHCHIFLFSDEPELAAQELAGLGELTLVSGNTQEEDLHLMSACRHNIIANSTYSWWAAWLNRHPDKIVIAPRRWFGPELADKLDTRDMFPPDWQFA